MTTQTATQTIEGYRQEPRVEIDAQGRKLTITSAMKPKPAYELYFTLLETDVWQAHYQAFGKREKKFRVVGQSSPRPGDTNGVGNARRCVRMPADALCTEAEVIAALDAYIANRNRIMTDDEARESGIFDDATLREMGLL